MPRPNGRQFVTLYRGLAGIEPDEVNYKKLGMHWTTERGVADYFTEGRGSIIQGRVRSQHLITPDHPEWKELQLKHSIFGPSSKERERTVMPGSPVNIYSVSHVFDDDDEPMEFSSGEAYDELFRLIPKRGRA